MRKIIIYIVLIVLICSCKSTLMVTNKESGISIKLPRDVRKIESDSFKGKYSSEFYLIYPDGSVSACTEIYLLKDSVVLGLTRNNTTVMSDKAKRIRELSYATKYKAGDIYTRKELNVNGEFFLMYIYNRKDNEKDLFVSFRSDFTVKDQIRGIIRFPATYSLDMVEKKTLEILSGIKFDQK